MLTDTMNEVTGDPWEGMTRDQLIVEIIEQGTLVAGLNLDSMKVRRALLGRIRQQHGCAAPCGAPSTECSCENMYRLDLGETLHADGV